MAAGRGLGRRGREGRPGRPGGGGRIRGHLLRHRRRLRRRAQRADHRRLPARPPRSACAGGHQDGPPRRTAPRELRPRQLPRLERPFAPQPRRRPDRPGAAALPAHRGVHLRRGVRRPGHPGRGGAHRRVRRERGDLRPGAGRDRSAARGERADHPQPVPDEAAARGAARRPRGRRRHHRPGAARLRAAVRQVHQGHRLRGERPPHLQPARRGLRPGRDLLRRRLRDRCGGRRRIRGPGPRGVHPGPVGAALDHRAGGRHHGDPRRPQPGAGPRQRGRRHAAAAVAGHPRRDPGPVRQADPGAGRAPLVTARKRAV
ncbi:conserved hypothetical protein [Streptomyces misionensis JCM 4497]